MFCYCNFGVRIRASGEWFPAEVVRCWHVTVTIGESVILETRAWTLYFNQKGRDCCWNSSSLFLRLTVFSILLRQNVFIFYSKLNMDVILFCSTEVQYAKNVKILWSKLEKLYQQMSFRGFATKERILLTLELNAWIDQSVINDWWNNTEHPFPFKVFSNDNTSKSYLYVIFLFSLDRLLFKFWF